ncbi:MAG: class I SAM-dependent DNA methyltransferase [Anaerolineae bacterium]
MPDRQHTFGQFETPPDVADLLLGFCLRRPSDRLLDPSCGTGAFLRRAARWQEWLSDDPARLAGDTLWGIELDNDLADAARQALPRAQVLAQNFFTLEADRLRPFDAIIGNPPYTRAEWIGRLHRESGEQMAFGWVSGLGRNTPEPPASHLQHRLIPRHLWQQLGRRSGLHAYFFLHSVHFLHEGGRLGFVVPNGWLDVAYGRQLKQFLLDHYRIIAVIESVVERWFRQARVNTCLIVLEKCSGPARRASNLVRLVRLKRPLRELIPCDQDDRLRPVTVERLATRLLPPSNRRSADYAVRVVPQGELSAREKWGLALRAPTVYRRKLAQSAMLPLKNWASVQRGFTTGANAFFYLDQEAIEMWGIEPEFRRPLLKSLRDVQQARLTAAECRHELLWVDPTTDLGGTAAAEYIAWGQTQGFHLRRTCAARHPWYTLPDQLPAQLILPKGIWKRHFTPLLSESLLVDQQLYRISLAAGVSPLAAAALLNSSWFAMQCELHGRVNFGEGVLWLAAYEVADILLPDPRHLPSAQVKELEQTFAPLAARPITDVMTELTRPDRQALDAVVFDILKLDGIERSAVLDALRERVETRQLRARNAG